MQRYSKVYDKIPREVLLLKSLPCVYGKCSYCNYILDNSTDIEEIRIANSGLIDGITGEFGALEVLNSGSVFELPKEILEEIRDKADALKIKVLYFEAYYGYRKRLKEMANYFKNQEVRYIIGLETFDDEFRKIVLNKPFPTTDLIGLGNEFYSCGLLICMKGQTRDQIINDIDLAIKHFKLVRVNVFINNDTAVVRDDELVTWFANEIYPDLKDLQNVEVFLDNKDLGVYVQ